MGLFSGRLIFGADYYQRELYASKWVGLDNKNNFKQLTLTVHALTFYSAGIHRIGRIFASHIGVLFSGVGELIIGILRYIGAISIE